MPINRGRRAAVQLDDIAFTGLKIAFDVTKTIKSSPRNKATVTVHNVAEEVFEQLVERRRELVMRVYAGYEVPGLVFTGNPVKNGLSFEWDGGTDRVLSIEAQDGYRAYQRARLNLTLDAESVTLEEVVIEAAKQMGLPAGVIEIPGDAQLTQGVALYGPAGPVLERIAKSVGADVSIQNGSLQFLPKNKARRRQGPRYSNQLRNIVQQPKFTDEGVKLTVFLDSSIEPGDRFVVDVASNRFDGIYKAHTVQHSGDTWGDNWYTEIEGRIWTEPRVVEPTKQEILQQLKTGSDADVFRIVEEQGWNIWPGSGT